MVQPNRCVSVFPLILDDLRIRGGSIFVLAEPQVGRVFGFGTITLGIGGAASRSAIIDVAVHDHFSGQAAAVLQRSIADCGQRGVVRGNEVRGHAVRRAPVESESQVACASLPG